MAGADECNIKVICRVRPLNESEEKAGSKFVLKFPTDDSIAIAVSNYWNNMVIWWLTVMLSVFWELNWDVSAYDVMLWCVRRAYWLSYITLRRDAAAADASSFMCGAGLLLSISHNDGMNIVLDKKEITKQLNLTWLVNGCKLYESWQWASLRIVSRWLHCILIMWTNH